MVDWGVGVAQQTSISVPVVQGVCFFLVQDVWRDGNFLFCFQTSDHPAVPTTSIPTGFPCPLHSLP